MPIVKNHGYYKEFKQTPEEQRDEEMAKRISQLEDRVAELEKLCTLSKRRESRRRVHRK